MSAVSQAKKYPRFLAFLSMLTVVFWIACIVSQKRLVSVHSAYVCAAVLPYPFICIVFDMIAEIYGYRESRKTLWFACLSVYIFVLSVYFFAQLPAPALLHGASQAFNDEMKPLLRILIFNSIAFIVGQYINLYFFGKMYLFFKGRFFGMRSVVSTFVGDTLTFVIALFGDFSGVMKSHTIFMLVIDELLIMYLMAIILAIPASFLVSWLKKIEPEFNFSVSFNPFK